MEHLLPAMIAAVLQYHSHPAKPNIIFVTLQAFITVVTFLNKTFCYEKIFTVYFFGGK